MKKFLLFLFVLLYSFFVYAAPLCSSSLQCNDGDSTTIDICMRAGEADAGCANLACEPQCLTDGDCNDDLNTTTDVCAGAGRCTAQCSHLTVCGNGFVDQGETSCNCPEDANPCSGSAFGVCSEYACIGVVCKQTIALGCCGNSICEFKENYGVCSDDCSPKDIEIDFEGITENTFFVRGEHVVLKAALSADRFAVNNARLDAQGFFGELHFFNDGDHNDGLNGDNVYTADFNVLTNAVGGSYDVNFFVKAPEFEGAKTIRFLIAPRIDIALNANKENYALGDNILVEGVISRKTKKLSETVNLKLFSNDEVVFEEDVNASEEGEFDFSYRTSALDKTGNWRVEAFVEDEFTNTGLKEETFLVSKEGLTEYLSFELLSDLKEVYQRGESINFSFKVLTADNKIAQGVTVNALTPDNKQIALSEVMPGVYEGIIVVGIGFPVGSQKLVFNAQRENMGIVLSGSTEVSFSVEKERLVVEILEPSKFSFQVGEEVDFKVRVFYPNRDPVLTSSINSKINGKVFSLSQSTNGIYTGKYVVQESDMGEIFFVVEADDGLENKGTNEIKMEVSGISVLHYLRQYFYGIVLLLSILAVVGAIVFFKASKKLRLENLEKNREASLNKIRNIQEQYFKEKALDKNNYMKLLEQEQSNLDYLEKTIKQMREKK